MYKPLPNERRETREGKGFPANFQILIVEDERLVALDIEDMLRDNGIAEVLWSPSIARAREIVAANENLGAVVLDLKLSDGSAIAVVGHDVVKKMPNGDVIPYAVREGHEILADGRMVIPPLGTNQRRYSGVLGAFRLYMGDGYGIHGTDVPTSIGTQASHGCVRLRNEDIETLFQIVKVGTPVFIY